jgi:hypothetical protein
MIISGGARCNWRFFARHLTNVRDNGYVRIAEIRGLTSDTVLEALREMDAIGSGTRAKNRFYHANINPRYGEHLSDEQWLEAADVLERNLGLVGHARFAVEHEKDGRVHRHIVWSRVDPDTMTVVSDSFTARDHERTSRELEAAFDLEPVESVLVPNREKERGERGPKNWETFRGQKSGIDPKEVTQEVTALWNAADSGAAFAAALAEHGYILCKGDRRDFVIVDRAGEEHSLARRIEGQKTKDIRARMVDVDRDSLPSVAEGRELASQRWEEPPPPEPITPSPETVSHTAREAEAPVVAALQSPAPGFWERVADYASQLVDALRHGRADAVWKVEECEELLRADGTAPGAPAPTIGAYAAPMEDAIREGGSIPTRDGLTWWQRAGAAIGRAVETSANWARDRWSGFVDRLERERGGEFGVDNMPEDIQPDEPGEPGMEL